MERLENINFSDIMTRYRGQPHVRGTVDCNLLFLELFEPEKYERFYDRYKTIVGGVRVSRKEFGFTSISEYLEQSSDYKSVHQNFQLPNDIVVFKDRHDLFISTGDKWFGVNDNEEFALIKYDKYDPNDYLVFRKVN